MVTITTAIQVPVITTPAAPTPTPTTPTPTPTPPNPPYTVLPSGTVDTGPGLSPVGIPSEIYTLPNGTLIYVPLTGGVPVYILPSNPTPPITPTPTPTPPTTTTMALSKTFTLSFIGELQHGNRQNHLVGSFTYVDANGNKIQDTVTDWTLDGTFSG